MAAGRLTSEPGSALLFDAAGSWYQRGSAGWQALAADPTRSRALLNDAVWSWNLRNGALEVNLSQGQRFNFTVGPSGAGFGFSADRLRAAAFHDGTLFAVSDAFIELASDPDQLAALAAPRLPTQPADRLESLAAADGSLSLFRYVGSNATRWNTATQSFDPLSAADDPANLWRLVESPRLRLTRRSEQVGKELRLDDLSGGDHWLGFDFVDGRFPFDMVSAFDIEGDQLYVGSAAGLQVYPNGALLGLDQIDKLYDLSGTSGGALSTVTRIGRPRADPSLMMVRAGICVELRAAGAPQPCRDASLLDTRLRISTDLWEWTADAQGALSGVYYGRGRSPALPVRVVGGRFLHDRLRDVGVCQAHAFSVWEDGWITAYPDTTIALRAGLAHDPLAAFDPQRLLCLERDLRLAGGAAQAGCMPLAATTHCATLTAPAGMP